VNIRSFCIWILILTLGWGHAYSVFREHFNGKEFLQKRVAQLQEKLEKQKLKTGIASYQLRDYQQSVAMLLPAAGKQLGSYQERSLASVTVEPDQEKLQIDFSSSLFEKGKKSFREGDYETSNETFKEIIRRFPVSTHLVEAYFLLAEGKYNSGEIEDCLDTIENMITLFPEHDLTGFALIRMGQIFASRDRVEDAEQVFKAVINNFDNPGLKDQARKLIKEMTL